MSIARTYGAHAVQQRWGSKDLLADLRDVPLAGDEWLRRKF